MSFTFLNAIKLMPVVARGSSIGISHHQRVQCYRLNRNLYQQCCNSSSCSSSSNRNGGVENIKLFEDICNSRSSINAFDSSRKIDPGILRHVLKITQTAPSSFNLQPFKMIIVQSNEMKEHLSSAMLGNNVQKVLDAPVTIIFLSLRAPSTLVRKLMDLELRNGSDPSYVSSLPAKTGFLLSNGSPIATLIKRLGTHLMSPLQAAPKIPFDNVAWSQKNSMFAAQTLLLAAAAAGLSSAPMEGFDEKRVCYALKVPEAKYTIPLAISLGYPLTPASGDQQQPLRLKARYPLDDVCFSEKYGGLMDIPAQELHVVEKNP